MEAFHQQHDLITFSVVGEVTELAGGFIAEHQQRRKIPSS